MFAIMFVYNHMPLFVHIMHCRLLAHVFDPELDQTNPREFVVYAVPGGALGRQIQDFMESAIYRSGRNGAHKSSPHVTLCQFFKVCVCVCACVCVRACVQPTM